MYAGGFARQVGHSAFTYMKAKRALKSVFALLHRVPLIDTSSVNGIILVCS